MPGPITSQRRHVPPARHGTSRMGPRGGCDPGGICQRATVQPPGAETGPLPCLSFPTWPVRGEGSAGSLPSPAPIGLFQGRLQRLRFFFFRTVASRRVTSGSGRWRRGRDSAVTAEGGQRWGRGQERCPSRSIQPPPHPALLSHLSLSALPGRATRKPNPLFSSAE